MSLSFDGFSEYEIKQSTVKFGTNAAMPLGCVGKLSETLNAKTITKKCEGVVKKSVTRGDGTGELGFTVHMKLAAYNEMFGMQTNGFKAGVKAYGENSKHKEFCYTAIVKDEDGNIKYKAYPRCCIQTGITRSIENGAEEVAEIEVTATVMPDELGNAMYEAFEEELDATAKKSWLNNFTTTLISTTNTYAITMTVPVGAGVTIVDADGNSVGYCSVNSTGAVSVPELKNGTYAYVVYASGKTPKAGSITVNNASPTAITVTFS